MLGCLFSWGWGEWEAGDPKGNSLSIGSGFSKLSEVELKSTKCVGGRMRQVFTKRKEPVGRLRGQREHGMFYRIGQEHSMQSGQRSGE